MKCDAKAVLLLAISALVAVGCTGSSATPSDAPAASSGGSPATSAAPAEKITLSFWEVNAGPDRTPPMQKLIAQFEAEHPNIDVEYVGLPQADALAKIQTAIAGGAVPDVADPLLSTIPAYIAQDGLLPLDEQFDAWEEKGEFHDQLIETVRSVSPDGNLYLLPAVGNIGSLYYRKDWFAEKGVEPPTTWEKFYSAVAAMNDPSNGVHGFGLRGGTYNVAQLELWMFAESGIGSYFDANGKSTVDSPEAVAVIEKAANLYKDGYTPQSNINNGYKEMVAEFNSGQVAMIQSNIAVYPQLLEALGEDKVGVVALPPGPGGNYNMLNPSFQGHVVFKGSKHPEEAWELASFLASAESVSSYAEALGEVPMNAEAARAPWVQELASINAVQAALNADGTHIVAPPYALPEYAKTWVELVPDFQGVLLGQQTAQEFASKWATMLTNGLAEYKKTHP